jgi:hypothetical protein
LRSLPPGAPAPTTAREEDRTLTTYRTVRFYKYSGRRPGTICRRLTLEQARTHCEGLEASSATCTSPEGRYRTRRRGDWFDGYQEEKARA